MNTERFLCLDCLCVLPLTVHGRCSLCDSNAVVSEHTSNLSQAPSLFAVDNVLRQSVDSEQIQEDSHPWQPLLQHQS